MAIGSRLRFQILERDGYRCRYCGRGAPGVTLHVDHVHPQSKNGTDDPDNLVTACEDCNLGKGARVLGAPAPNAGSGVATLPSPDMCPECDDLIVVPALKEESDGAGGYIAHYRCTGCGHTWFTGYAGDMRATASDVAEACA